MPSKDPALRFEDILENVERIQTYTAGMDRETFAADKRTADAVERCLSRISEAAVKLGVQAERSCPAIPWRDIRSLGNRLRHEYTAVDVARIWLIVERDMASLKEACQATVQRIRHKGGAQS